MIPQDRRWRHRTNGSVETSLNGGRFAGIRNDRENFLGLQYLLHRHGNGLLGNFIEILEPAFADLLQPARMVKSNSDVWLFRVEVGGRIVERDVPIFTDAQKCNINWRCSDGCAHAADNLAGILAPIKQVKI